jgi:hypothetical protein
VVHFPEHSECRTTLAPDPDDIVWNNMGMTRREHVIRSIIVSGIVIAGLLLWIREYTLSHVRQPVLKPASFLPLSSCLGFGDFIVVPGDRKGGTLAREVDRAVSLNRRLGSNFVPLGCLVDFQRNSALPS